MNTDASDVIILSFSGRANGNCAQTGRYIQDLTGGTLYSFAELNVHPCGGCNCQCFSNGADCPHIGDDLWKLYDAISRSHQAIFVLPNHCDFPSANFFAFNERSLCYFSNRQDLLDAYTAVPKRFIAVSGSESENIRNALMQHAENPEILWLSAKAYGKKSISGDLMTVPEVVGLIENFIS